MFLGLGVLLIILPVNFILIRLCKNSFQALAISMISIIVNGMIIGLYTYGIINELQEPLKFAVGLILTVIVNLVVKFYLIQKEISNESLPRRL